MMAYEWPGNVRELRNVIERAILLESSDVILASHLPIEVAGHATSNASPEPSAFRPRPLREVEIEHIRRTLEFFEGNKSRAAKELGISRQTLRDKLRDLEEPSAADRFAARGLAETPRKGDQIPTSLTRS
jgi:DNA-binding NtrC family response regulator